MSLLSVRSMLAFAAAAALAFASPAQASPVTNGLLLHYDAGAGVVADGSGNVSQWTNLALAAHDAAQTNAAYQPVLTTSASLNNQPVLRFNSDVLVVPQHTDLDIGTGAGKQRTMFMVYESTATDNNARDLISKQAGGSTDTDWRVWYRHANNELVWGTGSAGDTVAWQTIPNPTPNLPHMLTVDLDQTGSTSGSKNMWVDGALGATGNYSVKGAATTNPLLLGAYGTTAANAHAGDIAEILVYNTLLSPSERQEVQTYLANKYFASSPAAAPVLGYWNFKEKKPGEVATTTQRMVDQGAFGRDARVGGSGGSAPPEYVAGAPGYTTGPALRFEADSLPVTFQTSYNFGDGGPLAGAPLNFGPDDSFTIETLFRTEMTSTGMLVTKDVGSNQQSWWMRLQSGRPRFLMDGGAGTVLDLYPTDMVNDGEWHHLAVVRDREAEEVRMYLDHDPNPIFSVTESTALNLFNTNNIGIGRQNNGSNAFVGDIDYVRISAGALSVNQFLIPEPSSLVLLGFAVFALLLRRKR